MKTIFLYSLVVVALFAGFSLAWVLSLTNANDCDLYGGPIGKTGLRVYITAECNRFRLGAPMPISVLLENCGNTPQEINPQMYYFDVFEIWDEDGNRVLYAAGMNQTMGENVVLEPGDYIYVQANQDLLRRYLIHKECEYSIRVRALRPHFPPSGELRFRVSGGTLPTVEQAVLKIAPYVPKGWETGRYFYTPRTGHIPGREPREHSMMQILHGWTHKERIDLYITQSESPARTQLAEREQVSKYLGKSHLGHFYCHAYKGTREAWPDYIPFLTRHLELSK